MERERDRDRERDRETERTNSFQDNGPNGMEVRRIQVPAA